jgi:hypothetical protein
MDEITAMSNSSATSSTEASAPPSPRLKRKTPRNNRLCQKAAEPMVSQTAL